MARYKTQKGSDGGEELRRWLGTLYAYWAQQQQQTQSNDLNEADQEILEQWQYWLSSCEGSADTQVWWFHVNTDGCWDD